MGHMDVISFISDGFNIYFPMILVLLCICTLFSIGSRILHFLGVQQFIGDDDMTQELVDEGRQIVQRGINYKASRKIAVSNITDFNINVLFFFLLQRKGIVIENWTVQKGGGNGRRGLEQLLVPLTGSLVPEVRALSQNKF
jgi:hypothetical protein